MQIVSGKFNRLAVDIFLSPFAAMIIQRVWMCVRVYMCVFMHDALLLSFFLPVCVRALRVSFFSLRAFWFIVSRRCLIILVESCRAWSWERLESTTIIFSFFFFVFLFFSFLPPREVPFYDDKCAYIEKYREMDRSRETLRFREEFKGKRENV